ncbi:MAG: hypothetical protein NVS3B20_27460 [Polyangiales bacterium]
MFIGTHLIFPRLAQPLALAAIVATPALPRRFVERATTLSLAIGIAAGASLLLHMAVFAYETNDASRVIDEAPQGRRAAAVIYGADTFSFRNGPLVHLAAYYAARKAGDWAFSFARFLSVPVRFKAGQPGYWPSVGWEFTPSNYNPRSKYARRFDLLFVKSPHDIRSEDGVRHLVFGDVARVPKLVSHHGEYWAFDTQGVPEDGTF